MGAPLWHVPLGARADPEARAGLLKLKERHLANHRRRPRRQATFQSQGSAQDLLQLAIESQGLTKKEFESGMQELLVLLPSLRARFSRLSPTLLVSLAEKPESVAQKLAELKRLFPSADVYRIIDNRPKLLLDSDFVHVPVAAEKLDKLFPEANVGILVEQQPFLLLEDIDEVIEELRRLFKKEDVVGLLSKDPSLITAVLSNRKLSMW